jgi:mannose-6-phosphate isomerase-like protein (cupin superfamily)
MKGSWSTALTVPTSLLLLYFLLPPFMASAQTNAVTTYSLRQLTSMADELRAQADKQEDSGIQEKRLSSSSMLAFRNKDGKAELHDQFTDIFVVLQGAATLITGGTVVNPSSSSPGETRGDSIRDGTRAELTKGDVVHIPAGVPHQLLLGGRSSFTYLVVKIPNQS